MPRGIYLLKKLLLELGHTLSHYQKHISMVVHIQKLKVFTVCIVIDQMVGKVEEFAYYILMSIETQLLKLLKVTRLR